MQELYQAGQPVFRRAARLVRRAVKIAFEEDGLVENMWVEVTDTEGDTLVGALDNHPVVLERVKFGDRVELKRTQIKAVDPPLENQQAG